MEIDKTLFRLTHISECIEKIQELVKRLHNYDNFGLQLDSIWDTAVNDIPILKKQINKIIQTFI